MKSVVKGMVEMAGSMARLARFLPWQCSVVAQGEKASWQHRVIYG